MSTQPQPDPTDPTTALERCQQEAKALAYAVSHDLRQPLRTILHNLQFLQRRAGDQIPPEHHQLLERALAATHHGQSMIEDLLTYSRLNTRAKPPEPVDLADLIARLQREQRDTIAQTGATLHLDDHLPTVIAERYQLYLLLHHLLDNALKFHHPDRPPVIHLTARTTDTHWHLTIRDNGLGLPPDKWDNACQLYKQLHPAGDYPGNGCGLAICQKVAHLHGATLTLQQDPDHPGTTLHLALPRPPDETAIKPRPKINIRKAGS